MTPVMYLDTNGEFPEFFLKVFFSNHIESYIKGREVFLILSEEVRAVLSNGNLKIVNSAKIKNTLIIVSYSYYLKYVKYPDFFTGSASGIAAEWIGHNVAYYGTSAFKFNHFMLEANKSAKDTDLAPSIHDGNNLVMNIIFYGIEFVISPLDTTTEITRLCYDFWKRED